MVEVETRYGNLLVPDTNADIIGRYLARYGEWGWEEVSFLARTLPSEGARILDVGAFVGTFGLGLALQCDLESVCLVEANSAIVPILAENIERNCTAPANVISALVGRSGKPAHGGRCKNGNLGSMCFSGAHEAISDNAQQAPRPEQVRTLETLRSEFGEFTLIKLDVEGMELELLESDEQYLSTGRVALWIECNEDPQSLAVAELLLHWELDLYYFGFPAHNEDNFHGDQIPIFPVAYEAGLLAAPHAPPSLDSQLAAHGCMLRRIENVEDLKDALWRTPRWGMSGWDGASAAEVAALAGHLLRGESYELYLRPGWSSDPMLDDKINAWQGLTVAAEVKREMLDLQRKIRSERYRADVAERLLADASALALQRLSEIGVERELRNDAELRLSEYASRAADVERELKKDAELKLAEYASRAMNAERRAQAIEHSTIWRATVPFQRAISVHPRLRKTLHRSASVMAKVARLLRKH